MASDNELRLLCQALVDRQFESVHDAEQALEQFENLTTPAAVLGILAELDGFKSLGDALLICVTLGRSTSVSVTTANLTSQE